MDNIEPYTGDEQYNSDIPPDEMCNKDNVITVGSTAVPLFFAIVILLSLFGNILVLVILGLYENLRSLTNVFILNLALSDLMFTFGLPFWACYYIWGWTLGDTACKAVNFIFFAGFYSSIVFLMLMTVQRYMAVVHPLSDWERGRWLAVIPVIAWLVSILAALPASLQKEIIPEPDSQILHCDYNSTTTRSVVTYQHNFSFVGAFLVLSFCYIRILQTVFKSRASKRHRTVRLIFCIVVIFFVGWAPYNIVIFLKTLTYNKYFEECHASDHLDYVLYICQFLAFSHCCLNPVLYAFIGVKFRNHLKMILHKISRRQPYLDNDRAKVTVVQSQGSMY